MIEYFFITVIEYNRHFSVYNCHLEVCNIVDRLLSDDSILCVNSKQRVSIFKKPSHFCLVKKKKQSNQS